MDRNTRRTYHKDENLKSLSARRAWIEMLADTSDVEAATVALRKESVDRNIEPRMLFLNTLLSLSARRAWIEIHRRLYHSKVTLVALRKESVDRHTCWLLA